MIGFMFVFIAIIISGIIIDFTLNYSLLGDLIKIKYYERKLLKIIDSLSEKDLENIKYKINSLKSSPYNQREKVRYYMIYLKDYVFTQSKGNFGNNILNQINSIQSLNIRIKELEKELKLK